MKKLGLGVILLIAAGFIYYFTQGSDKLVKEMKTSLHHELAVLQKNGFSVEEQRIKPREEHFELLLSDPKNATVYLQEHGIQVEAENIAVLEGMRLGIDVYYLPNQKDVIGIDIYPKALQNGLKKTLASENQKLLSLLENMMKKKSLLIHLNMNKMLSAFDGYVKDINETLEQETFTAKGITFEGDLENQKLVRFAQQIQQLSLLEQNKMTLKLSGLSTVYVLNDEAFHTTTTYTLHALDASASDGTKLVLSNLTGINTTTLHGIFLKSNTLLHVDDINATVKSKHYTLQQTELNATLDNLNIKAFEALQQTPVNNREARKKYVNEILSSGISLDIDRLSTKEIKVNGHSMGGYVSYASGSIDKGLDLKELEKNPFVLLEALDAVASVALSPALYGQVLNDPKILILLMLFPAQDKNGQKVFALSYHKGKFRINGAGF